MYVEWEGDPSHLRLVEGVQLVIDGLGGAEIHVESSGTMCILFEGPEKDVQAVFKAIRKRMGVVLVTIKWMEKIAAKRWKGGD